MLRKDKRITAKHIREMDAAGIKKVAVPDEFMIGRVLAHNVVDKDSGETGGTCQRRNYRRAAGQAG